VATVRSEKTANKKNPLEFRGGRNPNCFYLIE
jgi:hypothetical protein